MKKLKALNAELMIDKIELHARECIIDQFKATLKITKQRLCNAHNGIPAPESPLEEGPGSPCYDLYGDCTFALTDPSDEPDETQLTGGATDGEDAGGDDGGQSSLDKSAPS